ncbi:choice-of-anchor Q domain-containing protein [Leucobacter albus]|uniref:Choice-of-anchor Q domain-containing protein n=1 Tax=Leucobacter albus TaxID=272210 RepID=A0ABW3TS25_9MICO
MATDDGFDPAPGSLRQVLTAVGEESANPAGGAKDFVVQIAPGVGEISLDTDLSVELGEYARSIALVGAADSGASINLEGYSIDYEAGDGVEEVSFADLQISNGLSFAVSEGTTLALSATSVGFVDVEAVILAGEHTAALSNIRGTRVLDTKVIAEPQATPGGGIALTDAVFDDAPVELASQGGKVTVNASTFAGSGDETALEVWGGIHTDVIELFSMTGSRVADSTSSGLYVVGAKQVLLDGNEFVGIEGEFGAAIETIQIDDAATQALVTNSVFADNDMRMAPLQFAGAQKSVAVVGNEFRDNYSEQSGAVYFDAWLAEVADEPLMDERLSQDTFRFAGNTVANTESGSHGSVSLIEWVQHENTRAEFEQNLFSGNSSIASGGDVSADKLGEGREESDEILSFIGNTFDGSTGNPGGGQAVSIGWIDAAHLTFENNTFDLSDGDEAAVGIQDLGSFGQVDVSHNTFSGGGVEVANYDDVEPSAVFVRSTVFDTPTDPFFVDCECSPAIETTDTVVRSESGALPAAALATTQEIALGALGDNGGPLPTKLPAAGSVLLGAALSAPTVAHDQRGVARPAGSGADIGAVESVTGTVALVQSISVVEGEDAVIPVVRSAEAGWGAELPTRVTLTTHDGTAVGGRDYESATPTLDFPAAPGASQPQRSDVIVETKQRSGAQGDRAFTVVLADATNGANLGEPVEITVTITDATENTGPGTGPGGGGDGAGAGPGGAGAGQGALPATGGGAPAAGWLGGLALLLGGAGLVWWRRLKTVAGR